MKSKDASMNRLRNRWKHMRERCNNPKRKDYRYYGGRGIKVCKEWGSFIGFLDWWNRAANLAKWWDCEVDVYALDIDRINPSEGYCPQNCRLITHKENVTRAIVRNEKGKFSSKRQ